MTNLSFINTVETESQHNFTTQHNQQNGGPLPGRKALPSGWVAQGRREKKSNERIFNKVSSLLYRVLCSHLGCRLMDKDTNTFTDVQTQLRVVLNSYSFILCDIERIVITASSSVSQSLSVSSQVGSSALFYFSVCKQWLVQLSVLWKTVLQTQRCGAERGLSIHSAMA